MRLLFEALRAEGVSPIEDGYSGITGLSPEQRLLLAGLEYLSSRGEEPAREAAIVSDTLLPDVAPPAGPAGTGADAPEDHGPQTPQSFDGVALKPGPTDQLSPTAEEAVLTEAPGAPEEAPQVDTEPDRLTSDSTSEDELLEKREPHEPEAASEGTEADAAAMPLTQEPAPEAQAGSDSDPQAQQSVNPAVVENLIEVPQPGGVPMMPARASTQGDAAVTPLEIVKKTVYLKNARMNEPYVGLIEVPGLRGARLLDDGGTGLLLDGEAGTLSGQPGASGDFVVRIQGLLAGRRCDVHANLAVIPDPRSLWISKPHDPTAPFAKEDEDSGVSRGDLLCVAASKRGRSHAREGLFRDDDFALWTGGPGGWNIAVVADGAGSAKYSRRGSQIAVRTILRDLPPFLEEQLTGQIDGLAAEYLKGVEGAEDRIRTQLYLSLATAAFNAAKAIEDEATRVEERAGAFSTTLVLSVARKGPHGWFIAGFSIGDGGAAIFDLPSRTVKTLTLADSGEFAGQTRFLQKSEFAAGYDEVAKRLFFDVRDSFTAVLAMTDGITDPKFPTDSAFASSDVWSSFWETDLSQSVLLSRENTALEQELLAWLDFWSPGNHDDRTIAIMLP